MSATLSTVYPRIAPGTPILTLGGNVGVVATLNRRAQSGHFFVPMSNPWMSWVARLWLSRSMVTVLEGPTLPPEQVEALAREHEAGMQRCA